MARALSKVGELFLFERRGLLRGDTKTSFPSPDGFLETFAFNWDIYSLKETPYLVRTLMNSSFLSLEWPYIQSHFQDLLLPSHV